MKRTLSLIATLAALLFLLPLAPAAAEPPTQEIPTTGNEDILIVYVTPLLSMSPDWSRSHEDFLAAAAEYGFQGKVVGPNEINIEQMVADIETAIAEGADGIITCPLVPEAFEDVLQKAQDAGIPVVNVMADCCTDKRLTFIGTDPVALGQAYAEQIIAHSGGEAKVGIIMTDATTPNQKTELDEITKAIEGTAVEIVDVQYDHSQVSEAVEKSAAMLTAHPEINYLVCLEGACPNGVGTTVKEMGLVGQVNILAIDLQPGTIDFIKEGVIWASFTQSYYNLNGGGRMAAEVLLNYIRNDVEPSTFIDSGSQFWTVENVDEYGAETPEEVDLSDKLVVYVTPLLSMSPDWSRSHEDFLAAAMEYGFQGKVVGPNEINIEQMVADIETAIAEGADGIITCPLVPEAFEDVLQKAQDAGIPVVNVMADCCTDKRLTFIGTDPVALGQAYAEQIIAHSGGEAKVGIIMTDATTPNQKTELDEITKAIEGTAVEIVDVQYDHSQVSEAVEKSAAMLTAHPEINYLVCLEGACPNGVGTTVKEMGLVGQVNILAIDLQPGTIDFIKEGVIWASFTQSYYSLNGGGHTAAKVFVDYWTDGTLPPSFIDSGYDFWTVENVDEYGQ